MILGVLSDTHGRVERARAALRLLERLNADLIIHCGDVGSEAILDEFLTRRVRYVWGNTDEHEPRLAAYARALNIAPPEAPLWIEHGSARIAVYHGHELAFSRLARAAADLDAEAATRAAAGARYVLYGHTHVAADQRLGAVRLINPGALQRAKAYTVATVDLELDVVEHWRIDDRDPPDAPARRHVLGR